MIQLNFEMLQFSFNFLNKRIVLDQWFSLGAILSRRGHFIMSGDTWLYHNRGECLQASAGTASMTKDDLTQNVSSAEVEKSWLEIIC